jgi:16S rRNA (adenine1518-N6/adenine1519-N6)-dimethyltransferase
MTELNPASPSSVRRFLSAAGIRPSRRLGQSFLVDQGTAARIVAASGLVAGETCLEIGPGLGALTDALAVAGARVTAVEVDHRLAAALKDRYRDNPSVTIVDGDILRVDLSEVADASSCPVRVVANIPYSITTPIIERLLEHKDRLSGITLLVQKEVAERITASPGSSDYSSLTVFCAYHCDVRLAFTVPRHLFLPSPDVDSALIVMTPQPARLREAVQALFFRALRAAFSQRRKKAANGLAAGMGMDKAVVQAALEQAAIPADARAEDISLEGYLRLAAALPETQATGPR